MYVPLMEKQSQMLVLSVKHILSLCLPLKYKAHI